MHVVIPHAPLFRLFPLFLMYSNPPHLLCLIKKNIKPPAASIEGHLVLKSTVILFHLYFLPSFVFCLGFLSVVSIVSVIFVVAIVFVVSINCAVSIICVVSSFCLSVHSCCHFFRLLLCYPLHCLFLSAFPFVFSVDYFFVSFFLDFRLPLFLSIIFLSFSHFFLSVVSF